MAQVHWSFKFYNEGRSGLANKRVIFLIDSLVSHALSQRASLIYINQGFGSI